MDKFKEYRVGGSTDFNSNGGWLKIKVDGEFVKFYLGDDGSWNKNPLFICHSHWIREIIHALQSLDI